MNEKKILENGHKKDYKEENEKITVVGTFQNNKNFGFVVPDNKSFKTDIFISKKILEKLEIIIRF